MKTKPITDSFDPTKKINYPTKLFLLLFAVLCPVSILSTHTITAILMGIVSVILCLLLYYNRFTRWDNLSDKEIVKECFTFTCSDTTQLTGMVYHKKNTSLEKGKLPVVLSFHGFGSHHKAMDRYCLASIKRLNYIYFTYDNRGHGYNRKAGSVTDAIQYRDAVDFCSFVLKQPFVDRERIAFVGMSLGASKAIINTVRFSFVKCIILLCPLCDIEFNIKQKISFHIKLISRYIVKNLKKSNDGDITLNTFSSLESHTDLFNQKKIFIASCTDDPISSIENTRRIIDILSLDEKDYEIYAKGGHYFYENEWELSIAIFNFLRQRL